MLNIALFGPPGAGKGAQSDFLIKKYHLTHISPGNIFRAEIAKKTSLGKMLQHYMDAGNLVPEERVIETVSHALQERNDAHQGFLFDGYPRSVKQAEALDRQLAALAIPEKLQHVILLDVSQEEILMRLKKRSEIESRSDDGQDKILHRLGLYRAYSAPIIAYYQESNRIITIPGEGKMEEVHERIAEAIKEFSI